MDVSPIAYAVPVFFVLIGIEVLVARHRGLDAFSYHDAVTDLSCGIGSIVLGAGLKAIGLLGYAFVWSHLALFDVSSADPFWWFVALLGVDFLYYWFHRAGHRINFIWAAHVVHHQSEEYNLAVALRQSWFIGILEWVFHLPLAILGIPPLMWVASNTANTLYQFWIHTETVRTVGPLEAVFNTPSHHRVHHGTNPDYIDKNYGGILIIWDKIFGTFAAEKEEAVFGTIEPLRSWNPLWANVEHWRTIGWRLARTPGVLNKFRVVFGPPGWRPEGELQAPVVSRAGQHKYETAAPSSLDFYVGANYLGAIVATTGFMIVQSSWSTAQLAALAALIVLGVTAWGGMFERRSWAFAAEFTRLLVAPPALWWATGGSVPVTATAALASLAAAPWLIRLAIAKQQVGATSK